MSIARPGLIALILTARSLAAQTTPPDSVRPADVAAKVEEYLKYFTGPARDRMTQWLARGRPYRDLIRDRLARDSLPPGLEYLPLIESGYSNRATSRAGAVGMWQFLPETARRYGLRVDGLVDERR